MCEQWKPVINYEGLYEISNQGRVRRVAPSQGTWPGRILRSRQDSRGYVYIGLYSKGQRKAHLIHRLVAAAFIGPCPPKAEVNHKNGRKMDNRAVNLEYVSRSENVRHGYHVLGAQTTCGERNTHAKLGIQQVRKIRHLWAMGEYTQKELGQQFGIDQSAVSLIVTYKRWKHV